MPEVSRHYWVVVKAFASGQCGPGSIPGRSRRWRDPNYPPNDAIMQFDLKWQCHEFKPRRGLQCKNWSRQNSAQCLPAWSLTPRSVSLRGINSVESLILRISPQKRIFKRNHFNLFIRGPDGLD